MSMPLRRDTVVVLVMAERDAVLETIQRQLGQLRVEVRPAASLQEYLQLMREGHPAEVVISGVSLPDGNWCDVLTSTVRAGSLARVLVCSRTADERFWSEAIWRGIHDVLVEPFTVEYLQRCVDPRLADESSERETRSRGTACRSSIQRSNPAPLAAGAVA